MRPELESFQKCADDSKSLKQKVVGFSAPRFSGPAACWLHRRAPEMFSVWGWSVAPPPASGASGSFDGDRPSFSVVTPSSAVHLTLPGIRGWTAGAFSL